MKVSYFVSLFWFPPHTARLSVVLIWLIGAALSVAVWLLVSKLRTVGYIRIAVVSSIAVVLPLLGIGSLIEWSYWEGRFSPVQAVESTYPDSDGMTVDGDGQVRMSVAAAAFMLPLIVAGRAAAVAPWTCSREKKSGCSQSGQ